MLEFADTEIAGILRLRLIASPAGLRTLELNPESQPQAALNPNNSLIRESMRQLQAYFDRKLRRFDLPLDLHGTAFQKRVWQALQTISYGETRSYAQLAAAIGSPAARAVGAANGANPVAIVVPCHRVIGSSGRLIGYGGGLPLKKCLLELEGALSLPLGVEKNE
jgi:methylated-DNA-[protein]-cysteine S-methyltransferase